MCVQSLTSFTGLRIQRCWELCCRLQTWLGSSIAVAVVYNGSCSSDLTLSQGTSTCLGYGPKKKKEREREREPLYLLPLTHVSTICTCTPWAILLFCLPSCCHWPALPARPPLAQWPCAFRAAFIPISASSLPFPSLVVKFLLCVRHWVSWIKRHTRS